MLFQITVLGEALAALHAHKGLFSRVRALVHVQGALLDEAPPANVTAVRLLPGVCALVRVQVALLGIAFPAQRASERLFSRVTPLVDLKLAVAAVALPALHADDLLGRSGGPQVAYRGAPERALGCCVSRQTFAGLVAYVQRCLQGVAVHFPPVGRSDARGRVEANKAVEVHGKMAFRDGFVALAHIRTLLGVCWQDIRIESGYIKKKENILLATKYCR